MMMTRDEAIKLLRGGKEGIKEWNRRRDAFGTTPDLSGAIRRRNCNHPRIMVGQ